MKRHKDSDLKPWNTSYNQKPLDPYREEWKYHQEDEYMATKDMFDSSPRFLDSWQYVVIVVILCCLAYHFSLN